MSGFFDDLKLGLISLVFVLSASLEEAERPGD